MKNRLHQFNYGAGLQTSRAEDGLPLPAWVSFDNVRVHTGAAKRRSGKARVGTLAGGAQSLDLNGTDEYVTVPLDTRVWDLLKQWTLEVLVEPDDVTGTQVILGFAHATEFPIRLYLNGGVVAAEIVDSGTTVVTLTSATTFTATKLAIQVKRNGTAVELWVNGASEDTDTVADLNGDSAGGSLYFGRDNTGNYFNGSLDFVRLYTLVRPDQADGLLRFHDPIADYCTAHYTGELTADELLKDTSRYGNTGVATGAPPQDTTLAHAHAPVQTITPYKTRSGEKRVLMVAGGLPYNVKVG